MKTPMELTQLFRDRGLKVTPQRLCIFRILHDNGSHPTADAVFPSACEEIPTISCAPSTKPSATWSRG